MRYSPKSAIPAGGVMHQWSDPERTFRFSLVKFDLDCVPDAYPGVLILSDPRYKTATLLEVTDPRKEFPKILEPLPEETIAYWRIVRKPEERRRVMAGLTASPVIDDRRG